MGNEILDEIKGKTVERNEENKSFDLRESGMYSRHNKVASNSNHPTSESSSHQMTIVAVITAQVNPYWSSRVVGRKNLA